MKEQVIINSAEDFFHIFTETHHFYKENLGIAHKYVVSDEFGSGYINRYSLKNGIAICMIDLYSKDCIRFNFKADMSLFEVLYCMAGNIVKHEQGVGNFLLKKGQFVIHMKNKHEKWLEIPKDTRIRCISVTAYDPFSNLFSYKQNSEINTIVYRNINSEKIAALMQPKPIYPALQVPFVEIENCKFKGITKLMYLECKAMEIISIALEKEVAKHEKINRKNLLHERDRRKIILVEKIIVDNLTEPLSIKELARRVNLNEYKLKEGFKEIYGNTIFGYLKEVRLEKAKALLLANGEMNINEIVYEVGYSNTGHFARAFREKYGANPRDFRFRT